MARRLLVALAAALGLNWSAHAAPLEAYGRLPHIEQAAISPSGALIAFVVTDGDKRTITVQSTADKKPRGFSSAGTEKVRDIRWAGDDYLIVTTTTTRQPTDVLAPKQEFPVAQYLSLKTGRIRGLLANIRSGGDLRHPTEALNVIDTLPIVRLVAGKPTVFVRGFHFENSEAKRALFQVDLESGSAAVIDRGVRSAYDWVIDEEGQVVARALYNDAPGAWTLMVRNSNGWRTVETLTAPIETPELGGLGRDGRSILVMSGDDLNHGAWREVSLEAASWGDAVPGSEAQDPVHDPSTSRLIGSVALQGEALTYTFYDKRDAAVWRAVSKAFPGDIVSLASWSDDRKKIVVRVDSAELGPAYALVDLTSGEADWLGPEYAGLKASDISPVKHVSYRAADGLEISGYLTLPRGHEVRNLPLVVLAHGGPAARDRPGFDWWAQALASRGYAVLQPNFRGSFGFGADFYRAGFGEFGRKMQTDLSDGVRDLVRQGVVDPKRVCIAGGSYGGYAALAGTTLDQGVYRCAISYAGPSHLRSLISDSRQKGGRDALRYWQRFIGARSLDDPVLTTVSPAAHAAQANAPVLLIHGRDDTVVPISQSRRMADALRSAGKSVEFVELSGEDHWLSRGETRLQMLQASVAFLEKHNPPN